MIVLPVSVLTKICIPLPPLQPQHQVKSGLLLDVVVGQCTAVLQLLAGKDQSLLVWRDALLVLDLGLHILDGVRRLTSRVMVLPVRVCRNRDQQSGPYQSQKLPAFICIEALSVWAVQHKEVFSKRKT